MTPPGRFPALPLLIRTSTSWVMGIISQIADIPMLHCNRRFTTRSGRRGFAYIPLQTVRKSYGPETQIPTLYTQILQSRPRFCALHQSGSDPEWKMLGGGHHHHRTDCFRLERNRRVGLSPTGKGLLTKHTQSIQILINTPSLQDFGYLNPVRNIYIPTITLGYVSSITS